MKRVAKILVCFVTASGGCAATSNEAWTPPGGDGKADGAQLLKGSDIPSQYVDPGKTYVRSRYTWNLRDVGALTDAAERAAKKADAIVPNVQPNNALEAAELVAVEHASGTLTPDEEAALPLLWSWLEVPDVEQHIPSFDLSVEDRSAASADAVLAVPEPGSHTQVFGLGGITLTQGMTVDITEKSWWNSNYRTWTSGMTITGRPSATIDSAGGQIIVRQLGGTESVLRDTHNWWSWNIGGEMVFERFINGALVERHRIAAAPYDANHLEYVSLNDKVDYTLVLHDGTPLARNVYSVVKVSSGADGEWHYARTPQATNADPQALEMLATPVSSLAPGRYEVMVANQTVTLDLYANGAVMLNGTSTFHTARNGLKAHLRTDSTSPWLLVFVPTTNQLRVEGSDGLLSAQVIVTSAMRIP